MNDASDKDDIGLEGLLSPVMSENAFALWGAEDVAYIKQVTEHGGLSWAIFAADGRSLGALPDRNLAFATATQNDRFAMSVH
jgi:hypothetical protein